MGQWLRHGLQPDQLDAIPVEVRKNRACRQEERIPSPLPHRAQRELFLAIDRRRTTRPRREHRWVRTRVVFPRLGVARGEPCGPKVPTTGVPRQGLYRPIFLTRPPTDWHRRRLALLSNTPQSSVVLATTVLLFAVVYFVVSRGRRIIFLRGAVCNGRKCQAV